MSQATWRLWGEAGGGGGDPGGTRVSEAADAPPGGLVAALRAGRKCLFYSQGTPLQPQTDGAGRYRPPH